VPTYGYGHGITQKERTVITCFIRYDIDPFGKEQFAEYAQNWGQAIPRCGADLIGYFGPYEGSATTAYGVYSIESLAAYETYRARLKTDPIGRENYAFARREGFIRKEDRMFLRCVSGPHAALIKP
jgi:NIPSNAP